MKTAGRPTVQPQRVTVTLAAPQAATLKLLAGEAGVTISAFCAHVLERYAVQDQQVMATDAFKLLIGSELDKLREEQRTETRAQMHRLSHLLARTALESIATRAIGGFLLQQKMDEDTARKYYQQSWKVAVDALKRPSEGVKQSLNELIAGAGQQDPGVVMALRASNEAVRGELNRVAELEATVTTLQQQQHELIQVMNRQLRQMQETQTSMTRAIAALNQAEQDWHEKPKRLF